MKSFTNKEGSLLVKHMIVIIQQNKDYLSNIDGAIGDGDHGINMNKGCTLAKEELDKKDCDLTESLLVLAHTLMNKIGGSMGPLYGSIFMGMSRATKDKACIDGDVIATMLLYAYENIKMISPAKVGDKTLVDVLEPAMHAYQTTWIASGDVIPALKACEKASECGMLATKSMQAKIGRAARLKEKSIGQQDAGATSCCLLLKAMCETARKLMEVRCTGRCNDL